MKIESKHIPDELFKEIVSNMPICTVDIVFFNEKKDRIFLCKRANEPLKGVFMTNGGRLFKNEELEDCAIRQVKTELGISINKNQLVFGGITNMITNASKFDETNYHAMDIFFGYIINESTPIKLDNQHSESKWFSIYDESLHLYAKRSINILIPKL
ncbi:MAG: NUDIX domain-containing protein [Candidatus Zambryskibacteria bacterium]|nr:NUDIX domain-containing protein [Candidatus Zambryskibacteria bacterium]